MTDISIPRSYVIVTSYIRCCACGHNTVSSEFFTRTLIRARHSIGKPVTHLEHCAAPLYRIPVEHVAAQRTTAFCIRCPIVDLSHLPLPPNPSQLYDLAEPSLKHTMVRKSPPSIRQPKPSKPSIKDLA